MPSAEASAERPSERPTTKILGLKPRTLEGAGARAYAAQENAWEAAIMFSVAVITTHLAGLSASAAAPFTIAFVLLRVVHAICYIKDIDKVRSLSFILGLACMITLFVKAA